MLFLFQPYVQTENENDGLQQLVGLHSLSSIHSVVLCSVITCKRFTRYLKHPPAVLPWPAIAGRAAGKWEGVLLLQLEIV
jgi:hypothetical protein